GGVELSAVLTGLTSSFYRPRRIASVFQGVFERYQLSWKKSWRRLDAIVRLGAETKVSQTRQLRLRLGSEPSLSLRWLMCGTSAPADVSFPRHLTPFHLPLTFFALL